MLGDRLAQARNRLHTALHSPSDRKAILFVLAIAAGFLLLTSLLHLPHGPEHWSADFRTAHWSKHPATQHKRIVIVYVTEKTLESYPYLSPTDRGMLADLIKAVDAAGPTAIGFDFIIDRPTEPAKDAALLAAVRDAKAAVVLGAVSEEAQPLDSGKTYQAEYLEKANRSIGHLHFDHPHRSRVIISDHVVRLMAKPTTSRTYPVSFAEQLAQKAGSYPDPKSEYISWLLSPIDHTETFLTLSADQVLGKGGGPALPIADLLRNRVVLIGGNFPDRDQHLIPLSVSDGQRYPGLFIHAQILAQIIDGRSLSTLSMPVQAVIFVLATALGFWVGRRQTRIHLVTELVSVIALVAIGILTFIYLSLIFPYTGVLLTWLAGVSAGYYSRPQH
jgi:CHASE2 domain-containing sensor protein